MVCFILLNSRLYGVEKTGMSLEDVMDCLPVEAPFLSNRESRGTMPALDRALLMILVG